MTATSQSRIFLCDERPIAQTTALQTRAVFPGVPFLHAFHDHLMAPGASVSFTLTPSSSHCLLPLSGALHYTDALHEGHYIAAGQAQVINTNALSKCRIQNPFGNDYINFLHIQIPGAAAEPTGAATIITYDDVNLHLNRWLPVSPGKTEQTTASALLSVAKFSGRGEAIYTAASPRNQVLVYAIEGAFETAGCLLHARDGLLLSGYSTIEAEALSNDAIALLLELYCQ